MNYLGVDMLRFGKRNLERTMMQRGLHWLGERFPRESSLKRALELCYDELCSIPGGLFLQQRAKRYPELTVGDLLDALNLQEACEEPQAIRVIDLKLDTTVLYRHGRSVDPNKPPIQMLEFGDSHGQTKTSCPHCVREAGLYPPKDP